MADEPLIDDPWQWIDDLTYAARWVGVLMVLLVVLALSAGALVHHWPEIAKNWPVLVTALSL